MNLRLISAVMCIGFNSLHEIPPEENPPRGEDDSEYEAEWSGDEDGEALMDKGQNYPQGKRLWTWLIICDDGLCCPFCISWIVFCSKWIVKLTNDTYRNCFDVP